jgi:hypothetical protein
MFWTWNSGYQSLNWKDSHQINPAAHIIAYHIGGYRLPIALSGNQDQHTDDESFRITRK